MNIVNRLVATAILSGAFVLATPAMAQTTYSNVSGPVSIFDSGFGNGRNDVPIFGQVFTAPSGNLLSWTFYNDSTAIVGATFAVAAWNGTTVTGSNLFSAASNVVAVDPANNGFYSHTVVNINLALIAGQSYYAYYTTYNTPQPLSGVTFEGAITSPLDGAWTFSSSRGAPAGAAYTSFGQSLVYSATFNAATAAVPEATTWAMMMAGFGVIGFGLRRHRRSMTRVAYA